MPADGSQQEWRVSTNGGAASRWSYDGTEIFYVSIDDWMHAARVTATDRFSTAAPERLFQAFLESEASDRQWDLAPDGAFLLNRRSNDASNPVTVVLGLNKLLEP